MKKITGVLTPILVTAVLLIAGCESEVLNPASAVNEEINKSGQTVTFSPPLPTFSQTTVTGITTTGTLRNVDDMEFTFSFTGTGVLSIDEDALSRALEIRELRARATPAAGSDSEISLKPNEYQTGTNLVKKVLYVNDRTARIQLSLSGLVNDRLEIHVKAGEFTANGGSFKLNLDGDLTSGEKDEDDIFEWVQVSAKTGSTLAVTNGTGADGTAYSVLLPNPRVVIAPSGLGGGFGVDGTPANGLTNAFFVPVTLYADTEGTKYIDFLKTNLKIEKYVDGKWTAVAVTAVEDSTPGLPPSPARTYIAKFAGEDRAILRARLENVKSFITGKSYYGYQQKITTGDNAEDQLVVVDNWNPLTRIYDQTLPGVTVPPSIYGLDKYTNGSVISGTITVIKSDTKGDVYIRLPLNNSPGTAMCAGTPSNVMKQLDGITKDTVKIVAEETGASYFVIPWEEFSYEPQVATDGTVTPAALLLKLPASYKVNGGRSFNVYFSPDVKNGDGKFVSPTGVYMDGIINGMACQVTGGLARL